MRWLPPALLLLAGCDVLDDIVEDPSQTLSVDSQTVQTGNDGMARIKVEVNGHRSFMVTAEKGSADYVAVEEVLGPNGDRILYWEDWYNSKESLTYAFYADVDTVLNWPVREADGQLKSGTYTVVVGAYRAQGQDLYYEPGANLEVTVHRRQDGDLSDGSVKAVVVYAKGLSGDATVTGGVQSAVSYWKEIWGAKGMALTVRYESSNIDPDLPFPGYGNPQPILDAAALAEGDEIVVLIGESIDGDSNSYLGVSGNIPGTLIETSRSATVVSWLANAGRDGQFNEQDIQLFGETLAHEVGHYTGLFHPVEDGWKYWDALEDTARCESRNDCENALGSNLMFPYPVCDFSDCVAQKDLTQDQRGVMQRYTGTK